MYEYRLMANWQGAEAAQIATDRAEPHGRGP